MHRLGRLRSSLSFANVMSTAAVFIALGGTSYAAITVTGRNVRDGSLTGADIRNNSVASKDVKDGSLLTKDFKAGQLPGGAAGPAGPVGAAGPAGPAGPKGDPGAVDLSGVYSKDESDGRFLGLTGKAADAETLDGVDATGVVRGAGSPRIASYQRQWSRNDAVVRPLPELPGLGTLGFKCALPNTTGTGRLVFTNTLGATVQWFATIATGGTATVTQGTVAAGATEELDLGTAPSLITWQLSPSNYSGPGPIATVTASHFTGGAFCHVRTQVVSQDPVRG
jgi:hypothetical protein